MKSQEIPKHTPLSLEEMRVGGSDRLTIEDDVNGKCYASFRCYDGTSVVECSGAKRTCDKVVTEDFIVGVACNGDVHMCQPPFPDTPADTEDAQRLACITKNHKDDCTWKVNGVVHSGTCLYNPLSLKPTLFCSDTGFGTKGDDQTND